MSETKWVTPTAAMVQAEIAAPIYAQFTSIAMKGSQSDPVPQILADLVALVRNLASRHSALAAEGMIPMSLLPYFITKAKQKIFARIPNSSFVEKIKDDVAEADRVIRMLAKGEWPIEPPTNPVTTQPVSGAAWGSDSPIDL